MKHLAHIIKGKNIPEFMQKEVEWYKCTFDEVHLPHQKVEEICKKVCKRHAERNDL